MKFKSKLTALFFSTVLLTSMSATVFAAPASTPVFGAMPEEIMQLESIDDATLIAQGYWKNACDGNECWVENYQGSNGDSYSVIYSIDNYTGEYDVFVGGTQNGSPPIDENELFAK